MELHYCEHFDNEVFYLPKDVEAGVLYTGDRGLLEWLEAQLGLPVARQNVDYLRIELYRQALAECASERQGADEPFYRASFAADPWATTAVLLRRRDELLSGGWDFHTDQDSPARLVELAQVEKRFRSKAQALPSVGQILGVADRFERVLKWLDVRPVPLRCLYLYEPSECLLPHIRRLISLLRRWDIRVESRLIRQPLAPSNSDLWHWQSYLCGRAPLRRRQPRADGSLQLFRAQRDSDAALFLSEWLAREPDFRPLLLLPKGGSVLELALIQQGFPAMGIPSASLARPSFQTLKLAPVFLWAPVDVFKVMEFLTLPLKPFDDDLAVEIARVLADKPGLFSDMWFAAINDYFSKPSVPPTARKHYEFWFVRKRYPIDQTAPTAEAAEIFEYIHRWAAERAIHSGQSNLRLLAEQARQVRDVLLVQPYGRISALELERIIRTLCEPVPLSPYSPQQGSFCYIRRPGALAQATEALCWWNSADDMPLSPVDYWQPPERRWLQAHAVLLLGPREHVKRQLFWLRQPVLYTTQQIILFLPNNIEGQAAQSSVLLGDLQSLFSDLSALTIDIDADIPDRVGVIRTMLPPIRMPTPGLHIALPPTESVDEPLCQTPTELEQLLYFPHRWFFRQKMRFYSSSLLSIAREEHLLGKLAHRFFELLFSEPDCLQWDKADVFRWVEQYAYRLIEREGATLLLYGRETERHYLLSRVKTAAWSLMECIKADHWEIVGTEVPLEGVFCDNPLRGRADLLLQRHGREWAIVDLKWRGAQYREALLQNEEDIQLVLYSYLLSLRESWAHTAYFIIEDARMIARDREAFRYATAVSKGGDPRQVGRQILERIERTFLWRREQILGGQIELRYNANAAALESKYEGELLDKLEMKSFKDSKGREYLDEYFLLVWGDGAVSR